MRSLKKSENFETSRAQQAATFAICKILEEDPEDALTAMEMKPMNHRL